MTERESPVKERELELSVVSNVTKKSKRSGSSQSLRPQDDDKISEKPSIEDSRDRMPAEEPLPELKLNLNTDLDNVKDEATSPLKQVSQFHT